MSEKTYVSSGGHAMHVTYHAEGCQKGGYSTPKSGKKMDIKLRRMKETADKRRKEMRDAWKRATESQRRHR